MTEDLVDLTRRGAAFEDRADAEATVDVTLRALGESLTRGEAAALAEHLPAAHADTVTPPERARPRTPPEYEAFLDRVAEETDVSTETAERRVRAVMAALARVVGEPELADARAQLPPEYGRAFETGGLLAEEPFADAVADATDLDDEEAEVAAAATLKTLGERLSRGEAEDVAHYLQADAATWLTAAATEEPAAFDADVFLARVADRADVAEGVAAEYADAVSDALAGVVPNRELSRMAEQLPDEYERVLAPAVSR